jgi:hypothetical protein
MKNKKSALKKIPASTFLLTFFISFCCVGYFYQYLVTTALTNPYAGILLLLVIVFIALVSLVPAFLVYYSFINKRFIEFSLLFFGSFFGLVLIYGIEFTSQYHPMMQLYVSLHDLLFDTYKINIYYLDYGGFGMLVAGLSAAIFGVFSMLGYVFMNRSRTN